MNSHFYFMKISLILLIGFLFCGCSTHITHGTINSENIYTSALTGLSFKPPCNWNPSVEEPFPGFESDLNSMIERPHEVAYFFKDDKSSCLIIDIYTLVHYGKPVTPLDITSDISRISSFQEECIRSFEADGNKLDGYSSEQSFECYPFTQDNPCLVEHPCMVSTFTSNPKNVGARCLKKLYVVSVPFKKGLVTTQGGYYIGLTLFSFNDNVDECAKVIDEVIYSMK